MNGFTTHRLPEFKVIQRRQTVGGSRFHEFIAQATVSLLLYLS